MKPVLLINPNGSAAATQAMVGIARRHIAGVEGWTNPDGPPMITDAVALAEAAAQVGAAILPEARGVIVSAFGDPGAEALADRLDVPVVGIGAVAARAACVGERFAVATTTPDLEVPVDALMRAHAQGAAYLGCFLSQGDPLALLGDPAALDAALIGAVRRAAEAGADHVIIGGGPLAEAADRIADQVPVTLVQPLPEACRALLAAMDGALSRSHP